MIQPEMWSKNTSGLCTRASRFYMEKYKDSLNWSDNESILEFGIADGRNSMESLWPYLPNNFKEFIGSDISEVMVDYVSNQAINEKMKFIQFDISCASVPNEFIDRFDHIFSFFVMHWVQNTRQAFLNMYKMLKPGGKIFLIFAERTSVDEVYDFLSKHQKWGKYGHERLISPFHFSVNPQMEYEKIVRETGFHDYSLEVGNWSTELTEKSFEDLFYSVNPIIQEVPKNDVDEYKKEFMEKTKRNNSLNWVTICQKSGRKMFHSSYKSIVLLATKPSI